MSTKTGCEYIGYIDPWTDEERLSDEEIVRCRDCKYYREHAFIMVTNISDVCLFWHGTPTKVEPNGFCAWAERCIDKAKELVDKARKEGGDD